MVHFAPFSRYVRRNLSAERNSALPAHPRSVNLDKAKRFAFTDSRGDRLPVYAVFFEIPECHRQATVYVSRRGA
jgi:hypothetical protein